MLEKLLSEHVDFLPDQRLVVFLCSPNSLHKVASYLCLLPDLPEGQDTTYENEFLLELLVSSILVFYEFAIWGFELTCLQGINY